MHYAGIYVGTGCTWAIGEPKLDWVRWEAMEQSDLTLPCGVCGAWAARLLQPLSPRACPATGDNSAAAEWLPCVPSVLGD